VSGHKSLEERRFGVRRRERKRGKEREEGDRMRISQSKKKDG